MITGKTRNICNINMFRFCDLNVVFEYLIHLAESELVSATQRIHFFLKLLKGPVSN